MAVSDSAPSAKRPVTVHLGTLLRTADRAVSFSTCSSRLRRSSSRACAREVFRGGIRARGLGDHGLQARPTTCSRACASRSPRRLAAQRLLGADPPARLRHGATESRRSSEPRSASSPELRFERRGRFDASGPGRSAVHPAMAWSRRRGFFGAEGAFRRSPPEKAPSAPRRSSPPASSDRGRTSPVHEHAAPARPAPDASDRSPRRSGRLARGSAGSGARCARERELPVRAERPSPSRRLPAPSAASFRSA